MADRNILIAEFLSSTGWINASRTPLVGDASFRQYERITFEKERAIFMDAPPEKEDVRPFLFITEHLRSLGYSAPKIYAADPDAGFILMEDLGNTTFTLMLAAGADETELYKCAVDLLIDLHSRPARDAVPARLPLYDDQKLLEEVNLFTDWYIPQFLNSKTADVAREKYVSIWQCLLRLSNNITNTLVLRDFHADNLMWLPDRTGIAACGLLDYQDALTGPPPYDLMSLLEDARRDLKPNLADHLLRHYLSAFPGLNEEAFLQAFSILAAQRHCKVIGIFSRLAVRDGKFTYLSHIPRVWCLLEATCMSPILAPLKDWLDRFIQPELRGSMLKEKSK